MRYTFRSDAPPDYTICENETVRSVAQNILLIISTKRGTVPMYREFGLPMNFIDKPIPIYEAIFTEEVSAALEQFEPRARLISTSFDHSQAIGGKSVAILEVEIEP